MSIQKYVIQCEVNSHQNWYDLKRTKLMSPKPLVDPFHHKKVQTSSHWVVYEFSVGNEDLVSY